MARSVNLRAGTLEDLAGPSREAVIVLRSCWRLVAVGALIAAASSMSCSTILAAGEDGVLDSTFGVAEALPGVVELPDLDAAFRGALQSNGDLVVASNDVGPATRGLVRIDEFGQRDMSFGAGGLVDLGAPNYGLIRDVDVDSLDRIVVTLDSRVIRLLPDGQVDPAWTFDLVMDSNHFWVLSDATIDTAGRLLVTGTYQTQTQPMIARLTATGALDVSFAAGGDVPGRKLLYAYAQRDPLVGADGAIYLVGTSPFSFSPQFLTVEKLAGTGVADTTFGTGSPAPGVVGLHPGQTSIGLGAAVDTSGRLLVVGNSSSLDGTSSQATIVRLLADGTVDSSYVATAAAAKMRFPRSVTVLDSGESVVVGSFIVPEAFEGVPGAMVLSASGAESDRTGWAHSGNQARIPSLINRTIHGGFRDAHGRFVLILGPGAVARINAPTVLGFTGVDPGRLMDTRADGVTIDGAFQRLGIVKGGTTVEFTVAGRGGVAPNATAASLNMTVTEPAASGFVTVYPCGTSRPLASSLNFVAGQTVPNAVITKIGANGKVCAFSNVDTHLVTDTNGYFSAGSSFTGVDPGRLMDTRADGVTIDGAFQRLGIVKGGTTVEFTVAGRGGVAPNATAASLNMTVTEPAASGFVTVYPCGTSRPLASSLNFVAGQTVPNAVITKIGANGKVCAFSNVDTHLVTDTNGYFSAGSSFTGVDPGRLMDTRADGVTIDGAFQRLGIVKGGTTVEFTVAGRGGVAPNATAASLNMTVTEPAASGFVTVYPCGTSRPLASSLNFVAGQTVPNAVITKIGANGKVCAFSNVDTHLVTDTNGYFSNV